jgi:hypothetical protein
MMGMVRDRKFRSMVMWLVCIISLALCLHFNEHVTETQFQEQMHIEIEHNHVHEVNQKHSHTHHDNFYEHLVAYHTVNELNYSYLLFKTQIFDRTQDYVYLMISRIFKPPKSAMDFSFIFHFGV